MAKTLIPRDEHGIIQLMPDATVYLGGQNRNGLVQIGDAIAPLGDADLGVPNGQLFRPPYLYDAAGRPAQRPMISKAPALIGYGRPFSVKHFSYKKIKGVSIIRTGSMSHSLNTDVRMVKLAFKQTSNGSLTVFPPKLPGTAIGGYYQLFILDEAGVPSEGVKVALGTAVTKRVGKPKSPYALTTATPPLAAQ
jgi:galactose oxidase